MLDSAVQVIAVSVYERLMFTKGSCLLKGPQEKCPFDQPAFDHRSHEDNKSYLGKKRYLRRIGRCIYIYIGLHHFGVHALASFFLVCGNAPVLSTEGLTCINYSWTNTIS